VFYSLIQMGYAFVVVVKWRTCSMYLLTGADSTKCRFFLQVITLWIFEEATADICDVLGHEGWITITIPLINYTYHQR
jgi:hypothetical protein